MMDNKIVCIKTKVVSPFIHFVISWSIVLLVYGLHWSTLFPNLSTGVSCFFVCAIIICYVLFRTSKPLLFSFEINEQKTIIILRYCLYLSALLFFLGVLSIGSFPLLSFLRGHFSYGEDTYTLPFIHIILFTLSDLCVSVSFLVYRLTKNFSFLKYTLLFFLPSILFFSRSNVMFNLMYCLLIYLSLSEISFKYLIKRFFFLCIGLYFVFLLFGIVGELRSGEHRSSDTWIEQLTLPTQEFKKTGLSPMVLWGYTYLASPLSNFQNAEYKVQNYSSMEDYDVILYHFLPNFLSKRIFPEYEQKKELVVPYFTAVSVFTDPLLRLGWVGVFYSFIGMIAIIFFLYKTKTYNLFSYLTFLYFSTMIFFNIFSNMYNYMGLAPQFWVTLIMSFYIKKQTKK